MVETTSSRWLNLCLIDGMPNGMLGVEDSNWAGHVLLIPRDYIRTKKLHTRPEASCSGVYILLGEKIGKPTVYIGESTRIIERLSQHVAKKDWWEEVILVTNKTGNLNAAHIGYLETRLYEIVKKVGRVNLDNTQDPSSNLSGKDKSDMDRFLDVLLIILPTLRGDMFLKRPFSMQEEEKKSLAEDSASLTSPIFVLQSSQYDARMVLDGSDYIVLKGSHARSERKAKDSRSAIEEIRELKNKGILESIGDRKLHFTEDYVFKSASKAANVIVGYNVNGRDVWRVKGSRQSLKEWEAEQLTDGKESTKENNIPDSNTSQNQEEQHISDGKPKKSPFTFSMVNIPIGSEITFSKDKNIIAEVAGRDNEIKYEGKVGSISTITQNILNDKLGKDWPSAQGAKLWRYKGELLIKIRERFEQINENDTNLASASGNIGKSVDAVERRANTRIEDLPNLTHTAIKNAVINGEEIKEPSWRSVLYHIIDKEGEKGKTIQFNEIKGLKIKEGNVRSRGYSYREKAGVSIPSLDSNQCAEAIIKITECFNLESVNYEGIINYEWRKNPKAARPGEEGSIII